MIEFAMLMPVIAALVAGFAGVGVTFLRSLQAEELCRTAVRLAASGADLTQENSKQKLFSAYGGATLAKDEGVVFLRHIVRDGGGYRIEKHLAAGNNFRWHEPADTPQSVVQLEPGEDAWVADIWIATNAIGGIAPEDVHARFVQ